MNTLVSPDVLRDFNFGNKPTAKNVSIQHNEHISKSRCSARFQLRK